MYFEGCKSDKGGKSSLSSLHQISLRSLIRTADRQEGRTASKCDEELAAAAAAAAAAAKSLQSCPTLCDPIDGSPPGSPVPGILQARTLEWVAISFSNA